MTKRDIRWIQRFTNFRKALEKLRDAIEDYDEEIMSDLEKEGVIQRFEYTFELSWKTLQDLLAHKGYTDVRGPNPVLTQALRDGYIKGEKAWREMKEARELTSHTYDEEGANAIVSRIVDQYYDLLFSLKESLDIEAKKEK